MSCLEQYGLSGYVSGYVVNLFVAFGVLPSFNDWGVWGPLQVKGLFWNYFSVGLDAQAAYGFHSLREKRPWATPTRCGDQEPSRTTTNALDWDAVTL